jgi:hypothetical protein
VICKEAAQSICVEKGYFVPGERGFALTRLAFPTHAQVDEHLSWHDMRFAARRYLP